MHKPAYTSPGVFNYENFPDTKQVRVSKAMIELLLNSLKFQMTLDVLFEIKVIADIITTAISEMWKEETKWPLNVNLKEC